MKMHRNSTGDKQSLASARYDPFMISARGRHLVYTSENSFSGNCFGSVWFPIGRTICLVITRSMLFYAFIFSLFNSKMGIVEQPSDSCTARVRVRVCVCVCARAFLCLSTCLRVCLRACKRAWEVCGRGCARSGPPSKHLHDFFAVD